mgnify:CR=1 FL=1
MKKVFIIIILIISIFFIDSKVLAKDKEDNVVNLYLFHSEYCSHCKEEIKLLDRIEKKYSNVHVYKYEISESEKYIKLAESIYNIEIESVPTLIIGEKIYTGYLSEETPFAILSTIDYYSKFGYNDLKPNNLKKLLFSSYLLIIAWSPLIIHCLLLISMDPVLRAILSIPH